MYNDVCSSPTGLCQGEGEHKGADLYNMLLNPDRYSPHARPVKNQGATIPVTLGIELTSIERIVSVWIENA